MWLVFYWLIAKIATGVFLHPNAVLLEFQIRLGTCSGGYVSTKNQFGSKKGAFRGFVWSLSSTSRGFLSLHYGCVLAFQRCGIHILLGIFDERCSFPVFLNLCNVLLQQVIKYLGLFPVLIWTLWYQRNQLQTSRNDFPIHQVIPRALQVHVWVFSQN